MVERREELEKELEKITERLKKDQSVRLVLLFGSLARGDVRSESDIDLLVVKETDKSSLIDSMNFIRMPA